MDDLGRQIGCLLHGLIAALAVLAVAVLVLSGLIVAGVL